MSESEIRSTEFFSHLPDDAAESLIRNGIEHSVAEGEWVYRQGDAADGIFLLVSGSVESILVAKTGIQTTVFNWKAGDLFGEECLFVSEARRESARAVVDSKIFLVGRETFKRVQSDFPQLAVSLSNVLFRRILRMNEHLHHSAEMEEAYLKFIAAHGGSAQWRPLGRSESLKRVREAIDVASKNCLPVLLLGPTGTEKRDVARSIHANGIRPLAPFLLMDAKTIDLEHSGSSHQEDTNSMARELAQDLALFGCRIGIPSAADVDRLGFLRVASGGTVLIDHVENLSLEVQSRLADFIHVGFFLPIGSETPVRSNTRIMASTTADLTALSEEGKFHAGLLSCFQQPHIYLPPLIKRKKDILPMAEGMVQEFARRAEKQIAGIHPSAVVELLQYSWPGNTEELISTIRRAVDLAQERRLMPEDVVVSGKPVASGPTLNILQWNTVRNFMHSPRFPALLQWMTGAVFALIIALGFWGNPSPDYNVALILAWAVWEPAVFWGALFVGRAWCAVCPIGGLNSWISSRMGLNRRIPPWLRKHGIKMGAAGLAIILLTEEASSMPFRPEATAWLILAILIGGTLFAAIYARRTWCRYVCPFGGMVGLFSSCAALEIRANSGVCDNECKTHACYKGGTAGGGCPLFESPFMLRTNVHCVMCGQCLKNCPHGALRLNLRIPAVELWTASQPFSALGTYIPVVISSQIFRQFIATGIFAALEEDPLLRWLSFAVFFSLLLTVSAWWIKVSGKSLFQRREGASEDSWGFFAHALIPVSLSFELGYQTQRMLERAGLFPDVLLRQLNISMPPSMGAVAVPWIIRTVQIALCLLGTLASCALLKKLLRDRTRSSLPIRYPTVTIWGLGLLYLLLFIFGR